ncbi:NAD(P)H-binding [Pustulibacterium marinum]|uniref:NAD(P)H-binding n=1 Tax=Pustulibacterium marinum TaxID=1224947 RepID=A0A1I7ESQ9_9FLAO|nr:NAD(P)H-binding protein [Pustulibacterium marinum]SFU26952.1 NAD(P)H-binding [Pustulibacterium marinum]
MKKTAIILGVTGLTGGYVLSELLSDGRYEKIILFSRRTKGITHPKLVEHIIDVTELEKYKQLFKGDDVFCCIGTTQKKTPNKEVYQKVDYGIPVSAAELAAKCNAKAFIVISAMGANTKSNVFYNRLKGEMEAKVQEFSIPKIHIVRPALISGNREEFRLGEYIAKQFFKVLDLVMVGPLEKYKSIHPERIAKSMIWLANNNFSKTIVESDTLQKLGSD